jgi:hypothetical protein
LKLSTPSQQTVSSTSKVVLLSTQGLQLCNASIIIPENSLQQFTINQTITIYDDAGNQIGAPINITQPSTITIDSLPIGWISFSDPNSYNISVTSQVITCYSVKEKLLAAQNGSLLLNTTPSLNKPSTFSSQNTNSQGFTVYGTLINQTVTPDSGNGSNAEATLFRKITNPDNDPNGITITSMLVMVSAGCTVRFAIYSDNNGQVGSLIQDFGTTTSTGNVPTTNKITISYSLAKGTTIWLAYSSNVGIYGLVKAYNYPIAISSTIYLSSGFPTSVSGLTYNSGSSSDFQPAEVQYTYNQNNDNTTQTLLSDTASGLIQANQINLTFDSPASTVSFDLQLIDDTLSTTIYSYHTVNSNYLTFGSAAYNENISSLGVTIQKGHSYHIAIVFQTNTGSTNPSCTNFSCTTFGNTY